MNNVATVEAKQGTAAEPTQRSIQDIIANLSQPVNPKRLKTRMQGGKQITYLPWYQAVKYLDHFAPGWSYEVRSVTTVGDAVAITVRISIPCIEGIVWREATGIEPLKVKGYGDPTSNAESMALRRAAAKFGLCLYLYGK
jgi:Rad52/22 family double-strand break repair protein